MCKFALQHHCWAHVQCMSALQVEGGWQPRSVRRLHPSDQHLVVVMDPRANRVERCKLGWWAHECHARVEGSWRCCLRGQGFEYLHEHSKQHCTTEHNTAGRWARRACRLRNHRQGQRVPHLRLPLWSSTPAGQRKNCGAVGPVGAATHSASVSAMISSAGACLLRRTAGTCLSLQPLGNLPQASSLTLVAVLKRCQMRHFALNTGNAKALCHGLDLHGGTRWPDRAQLHLHLPSQGARQRDGGVLFIVSTEKCGMHGVWRAWNGVKIMCAAAGDAAARQSPANAKMA